MDIIYLICNIYCIYLIWILYILYIAYICRVKSEWYITMTSFTTSIGLPMLPMVLRMFIVWIQGTRMSWFNTRLWPEKRKNACIIYMLYISYM